MNYTIIYYVLVLIPSVNIDTTSRTRSSITGSHSHKSLALVTRTVRE